MRIFASISVSILLLLPVYGIGQKLSVIVSSTQNEVCNGYSCQYDGPTILINEVMMAPSRYDSSIKGCPPGRDTTSDCEGEWIELYNPHHCESVDISCYFLGNSAMDASIIRTYSAGFILPEGTIVPPRGFAIVRGPKAPPVPSHLLVANGGNTVEVVVDDDRTFIEGYRFWFPNAGGWFAFYDKNGVPQDAIVWGPNHNGVNVNARNPGVIGNCSYSGQLVSYSQISNDRKDTISFREPEVGKTFRRVPDGGKWDFNIPAEPTYGECNTVCIQPNANLCNGTATVIISGGTSPYTIVWNDKSNQTTPTAVDLCEGTYCVTVIDANNDTLRECVQVENKEPIVSVSSSFPEYCEGSTIELYADASQGELPFTYIWTGTDGFESEEQNPTIPNAEKNKAGIYFVTAVDSKGCNKTEQIQINIFDNPEINIASKNPYCEGDNIRLSLQDKDSIIDIEWTNPDGIRIREDELLILNSTILNSGNYSVSATTLDGCMVKPVTINIVVTELPVIDLGEDQKICEGAQIYLQANVLQGTSPFRFSWQGPTGFVANDPNPILTNIGKENEGIYYIAVHDSNECAKMDSIKIEVLLTRLLNIEGRILYCDREDVWISVLDTAGLYDVEWWFGENNFLTDGYSAYIKEASFLNSNKYMVSGLLGNGCKIVSDTVDIYIHPKLKPDFYWKPDYPTVRNSGVYLINNTEANEFENRYIWKIQTDKSNPETAEVIEDSINVYYRWTSQSKELIQGIYQVELIAMETIGEYEGVPIVCIDSIAYPIRIINDFLQFPNVVSPNGDGINDVFSIKNLIGGMAFPINELYIYDRAGRRVFYKKNIKIDSEYWNPNETNSPPGTYFYIFVGKGLEDVEYKGAIEVLAK